MPLVDSTVVSSTIETQLNTKTNSSAYNKTCHSLTLEDALNYQSEKWDIPITSEAFARKLDENDPLRHIRNEFFYPKNRTLPKGIFINIFSFFMQ